MCNIDFEGVRLIVADPNPQLCQNIRTFLNRYGFHDIIISSNISAVSRVLKQDTVDLVICDDRFEDEDVTKLVCDMRHRLIGWNPFVVVVILTGDTTSENIHRLASSGADTLLAKPISTGPLLQRLQVLAASRKKFVVTTDYIGPNRRDGHRPGTMEIPTIEVPNPVQARVEGGYALLNLESEIEKVTGVINEQKMERHAFQVGYLVDRMMPVYLDGTPDESIILLINRLASVCVDMSRRLLNTRFEHAGELCGSMVKLTERIGREPLSPCRKDIDLLSNLSTAIKRAFEVEGEAAVAHDISVTVKERAAGDTSPWATKSAA